MKMKYAFGTVVGISSLILVPILATAASSASGTKLNADTRPVPSQQCLQAQVAAHDLMATNQEETQAARQAAMKTYRDAIAAAAQITDDAARQEAVQAARDALRTAMQNLMPNQTDAMKTAMQAVRDACGGAKGGFGMGMGFKGGFGPMMEGRRGGKGMGMRRGWQQAPEAGQQEQQ